MIFRYRSPGLQKYFIYKPAKKDCRFYEKSRIISL